MRIIEYFTEFYLGAPNPYGSIFIRLQNNVEERVDLSPLHFMVLSQMLASDTVYYNKPNGTFYTKLGDGGYNSLIFNPGFAGNFYSEETHR